MPIIVSKLVDMVAVQPVPVQPAPAPAISQQEEAFVKEPVEFGKIGNTAVPEKLKSYLDSIAAILLQYPDLHIAIKGHTCDIGTEKRNLRIGGERARSVATYLEQNGVLESRIEISTAGEREPLVPNTSDENRKINRRVTITIKE